MENFQIFLSSSQNTTWKYHVLAINLGGGRAGRQA